MSKTETERFCKMKKILVVAFVAALAVVMTGCQKEEEKNPVAAATAALKSDADKAAKDAAKAADAAKKEADKAADAAKKAANDAKK